MQTPFCASHSLKGRQRPTFVPHVYGPRAAVITPLSAMAHDALTRDPHPNPARQQQVPGETAIARLLAGTLHQFIFAEVLRHGHRHVHPRRDAQRQQRITSLRCVATRRRGTLLFIMTLRRGILLCRNAQRNDKLIDPGVPVQQPLLDAVDATQSTSTRVAKSSL